MSLGDRIARNFDRARADDDLSHYMKATSRLSADNASLRSQLEAAQKVVEAARDVKHHELCPAWGDVNGPYPPDPCDCDLGLALALYDSTPAGPTPESKGETK